MTSKRSIFKRICSCLLAMSFIAAPVFAEETKSDDRALLQVEFLEALGVYDSDRIMMTETQDYLTRENLAVILGGFFGAQPVAPVGAENETGFLDIEPDHWAAERIQAVADRKIMSGYSDGYFRPDNNATFEQAIKTLVVLSGHDISADVYGGWSTGYIAIADELGITDGVSLGLTEPIRKGQFTQMLVNLLDAEMLKVSFSVSGDIYYENTEKLFMNEVLDIYVQKGIMTANEQTALLGKNPANKGYITVGGINIKSENPYSDYIGSEVKAFYKYDEYENVGELLWIEEGKRNSVLEVKGEDIINPNDNGYFVHEEGRNVNKVRIADILSLSVIYNGNLRRFAEYKDLAPKNGTVKLIDAQNDGVFETALVWNYYDFIVDSVTKTGDVITLVDRRSEIAVLEMSLKDNYSLDITKDGAQIDLNSITSGTVLSVAVDDFTQDKIETVTTSNKIDLNATIIKMVCSSEKVDGILKGTGSDEYTIDSQVLKFSPYFNTAAEQVFMGVGITAYLNNYGKIVYVELSEGWNYGFIKKVVLLDDDETVLIKIFTSDGEFVDYNVDKIRIDGVVKKANETETVVVNAEVITGNEIEATLRASGVEYQNATTFPSTGREQYHQMVKYFIKNKNLVEIDTVHPILAENDVNYDPNKFHITHSVAENSKETDIGTGNAKVVAGKMFIFPEKAKYFIIPPDLNAVDDYTTQSIATSRKNLSQRVLFDGDEMNIVPLILEIGSVQEEVVFRDATNYDMIFKEKSYELNTDGDPTYTLKGIHLPTGNDISIELEDEQVYDDFINDQLRLGDIVSWNQNIRGKATKIMRVYNGTEKKLDPAARERIMKKQNFQEGYNLIDGTVIRRRDNYLLINNSIDIASQGGQYEIPEEVLCNFSANGLVYVFESETKTLRKGSLAEIKTESKYGEAGADKIFLKYQGYTPMRIVIYK